MSNFSSLIAHGGSNCTDAEWDEYVRMGNVRDSETSTEWMDRIWPRLQYFRENNLLPTESKKYLEARKSVLVPTLGTYAPAIGLAICFSCDQLIYNGDQTAKMSGCNYIGMVRHWKFSCSGNKYCGVNHDEYLKIKQKSNSAYTFDDKMHMYQYGLWMQNAIRKIERAREISRKIRAAKVIQQKWIEYMYRPDGLCASELAIHFKLLWGSEKKCVKLTMYRPCLQSNELLKKLPPSIKKNIWNRITSRVHNPLSEEQASSIHSDIETLLISEIDKYAKKKNRQRCTKSILDQTEINLKSNLDHSRSNLDHPRSNLDHPRSNLDQTEINIRPNLQVTNSEDEINTRVKEATEAMHQRFIESTQETLNSIKQQKDAECKQIKLDMAHKSRNLFEHTLKKYIRDGTIYNLIHLLEEEDGILYPDTSLLTHKSNLDQTEINLRPNLQVTNSEDEINTQVKEATEAMHQRFIESTQETLNSIKQQKDAECKQIKLDMAHKRRWNTIS
ncbi:hypothetical protein Glove_109g185 [Diversispora epigaea]|uniref:Uncharacterized protein n=1 Tax=Diversispora epigaea TaxID=1348612 RepID=A0A397J2L4_9GLOM|nr:hypothetical protein Glove_109g185 [Diversispora epigaea]